jgi:hypothetical protein
MTAYRGVGKDKVTKKWEEATFSLVAAHRCDAVPKRIILK